MMNHYYIYTDASFSHKSQTGVLGFYIFRNAEEHEAGLTSLSLIHTRVLKEKNNIRVELRAVMEALETVEMKLIEKTHITLYTDCEGIPHLLERRKKLEAVHYISQRKKTILANADLYKSFFLIFDRLKPKIIWVKGHSPSKNQTIIQKNFSFIDKAVREKLREDMK